MYGHERSLVNELADKPFALIGVNTDSSLEKFQGAVKENDLNWRSFYDGNPGGKIVVDYAIESFPTIILIDENGVVQSFNPGRSEKTVEARVKIIDAKIKEMLNKLEP